MKTQLHTMAASGLCIRDVGKYSTCSHQYMVFILAEDRLKATDVKGFPVVSADGRNLLIGYIDRSELRYVLGMHASLHPPDYYLTLVSIQIRHGEFRISPRRRHAPSPPTKTTTYR